MKIALVCPASFPATQFGGILFLTFNLAKGLVKNENKVTIFTTDLDSANNLHTFNKNLPENEIIDGIRICRTHVFFSLYLFYINSGMYKKMLKEDFDVIHTVGLRSFQSIIATLVSKKRNIPLIVSDQGGLFSHPGLKDAGILKKILYKIQNWIISFIVKQASSIIVGNEYERQMFERFNVDHKIKIVRNGIDLSELKLTDYNFKKSNKILKKYFLFVGRFNESKGIEVLLNAIKEIKDQLEEMNTKCVVMGVDDGYQDEMMTKINELDISENIIVFTKPPRKQVISAYSECEFTILPSLWELSPLMPLEGFAFKKPCLATQTHGIPYTIEEGKTGILVEPNNKKELAAKIIYLLKNEKETKEMGERGFELVKTVCNHEEMVRQIYAIYSNLKQT